MIEDIRLLLMLHSNKDRFSEETLLSYMRSFKNNKISASMLQNVTGISKHRILKVLGKTSRTGGALNPESLEDILALATGEYDPELCLKVMRAGTSQLMLSCLTGIPQPRLSRLWRKHESRN